MDFAQIGEIAKTSTITAHYVTIDGNQVSLKAEGCCRLLYFLEGASMLRINAHLLSVEPDSLVVIPPDTPFAFELGKSSRYWQLCFFGERDEPLINNILYRGAIIVHLNDTDKAAIQAGFARLKTLGDKKKDAIEADTPADETELEYNMVFGSLLYACSEILLTGLDFKTYQIGVAERVRSYIDAHYTEPLTLSRLEKSFFVTRYHICRQFAKTYGITVMDYVKKLRVARAQELLLSTNLPVSQIAAKCGFGSPNTFHTAFHQSTSLTPLAYRKKLKT